MPVDKEKLAEAIKIKEAQKGKIVRK